MIEIIHTLLHCFFSFYNCRAIVDIKYIKIKESIEIVHKFSIYNY